MYKYLFETYVKPLHAVIIIIVVSAIGIASLSYYFNHVAEPHQSVKVNEIDLHFYNMTRGLRLLPMPPIPTLNDSVDKMLDEKYQETLADYYKRIELEDREFTRPYQLTTEYRGMIITDYGTAKEIDSLKCMRIAEIKRKVFTRDSLQQIADNELERLNEPCTSK